MNLNELDTIEKIFHYVFNGLSIITIHNEDTNNWFTFKITQAKKLKEVYWVSVLTQSENNNKKSYKFLGAVSKEEGYRWSTSAIIKKDAKSNMSAEWFFRCLFNGSLKYKYPKIKLYACSKCLACGRLITTPESLKTGVGHSCRTKQINNGTFIFGQN